jgi:hypothetical protein
MIKHKMLFTSLLITAGLTIQGCASNAIGKIDHNCPAPSQDQLNENGYLMLQNNVTLKCQVKNYTSRMTCQGITDGKEESLICNNGSQNLMFVFDEKGVLKSFK